MTDNKLSKGNKLNLDIIQANQSLESIRLCLRELELNGPTNILTRVKLNRTDCQIDTERLIGFLSKETLRQENVILNLEKEFTEL